MDLTMATIVEVMSRAEKLESDKNYLDAAALWERVRELDRAADAYRRGGNGQRAAQMLEFLGRKKEAAALWAATGQHARAGTLYEGVQAYSHAARAYLNANQREQAAVMCEKAEEFENAAKIYASLGNAEKAVQLYEKAGATEKAAELRQKHGIAQTVPAAEAEQGPSLQTLLEQAKSGILSEREVVQAVVQFLRAGRIPEAVSIYTHCQEDIGYPVLTEAAGKPELETRLAHMFYQAKDFNKAAQVLENLEQFDKAGQLYEHSDDYYMAAEMYVKAGERVKAAEMYERNGSHQQAADLFLEGEVPDRAAFNFERCQEVFKAGELYFKLGKQQKSLQLLQKVSPTSYEYLVACRMIGEVLAASGHVDLAIERHSDVVRSKPIEQNSAPIYYHLGVLLEQSGRLSQAQQMYQRILSWKFDYEDVQGRVQRISSGAVSAPAEAMLPEAVLAPAADSKDTEEGGGGAMAAEVGLVTLMDGFEFLRDTQLFQELSLEDVRTIYHLAELRTFAPGAVLIEQDQPGRALFIVRSGDVVVKKVTSDAEKVLVKVGPGNLLGEMSLIDDSKTSARVVADAESQAFEITKDKFTALLHGDDKLALKIYRVFTRTLADRLRTTTAMKAQG